RDAHREYVPYGRLLSDGRRAALRDARILDVFHAPRRRSRNLLHDALSGREAQERTEALDLKLETLIFRPCVVLTIPKMETEGFGADDIDRAAPRSNSGRATPCCSGQVGVTVRSARRWAMHTSSRPPTMRGTGPSDWRRSWPPRRAT